MSLASVVLIGANRSGKTIFLSHEHVSLVVFPPRGLFLSGSWRAATINACLKDQIPATEKENPWAALSDLLSQRRQEQRVRVLLHMALKHLLPGFLKPQPVMIVIDDAEELLRAYRADFLVAITILARDARDTDLLRLVLVINSENAAKALELLNSSVYTVDVMEAPKISRDAVVSKYGEEFAKVFDACDGCIGMALDYQSDEMRSKDMSAQEYAALHEELYRENWLGKEITEVEYSQEREHFRKKM